MNMSFNISEKDREASFARITKFTRGEMSL